jgi:hypothetical protein
MKTPDLESIAERQELISRIQAAMHGFITFGQENQNWDQLSTEQLRENVLFWELNQAAVSVGDK